MARDQASILVLDDDNGFRALVVALLKTKKYRVVEARSAEEADAICAPKDIALAIVDYRLVGVDGITWITKMREAGRNMPVIFVSGTDCDQKTFNWLRNILRVTLIVRKPIVAEVFLQQVELAIPSNVKALVTEAEGIAELDIDENDETSLFSTQGLIKQLLPMRNKLEMKTALKVAKANYAVQLQEDWAALVRLMRELKADPANTELLAQADSITHRVKGTAGSLGLTEVSATAAKMEGFLRYLDPSDKTEQDLIWSELFRAIATGETAVQHATAIVEDFVPDQKKAGRILLVTGNDAFVKIAEGVLSVSIEVAGSLPGANNKLKQRQYDAAIIDADLTIKENILELCHNIRLAADTPMPIALLSSGQGKFTAPELLFAGISTVLKDVDNCQFLEMACTKLLAENAGKKPRVLLVDDDKVLTDFVSTVLEAHDIQARSTNSPISTLQEIEAFEPDVLILDVVMPGLSGYEVCRSVRENEKWSGLPIVFVTGKTSPEARTAAFQAGGDDFFTKPVITEELLARVNSQLQKLTLPGGRLAVDSVTGLALEEVFEAQAEKILTTKKESDGPICLTIITVDDAVEVRVRQGAESLRNVIGQVGSLMTTHFDAGACRGRLDYDGFVLLTRGHTKESVAAAVNMLLDALTKISFQGSLSSFKATFTAGLADTIEDGASFNDLLHTAYRRLQSGRNKGPGVIINKN